MRKIILLTGLVFAVLVNIGCEEKRTNNNQEVKKNEETVNSNLIVEEPVTTKFELKNVTYNQLAKFAVSFIFNQQGNKTIKSSFNGEYYEVSYIRENDQTNWNVKIKFEENRIIWATNTGRWRYEEKIYFDERENEVLIKQIFSDGSSSIDSFKF